MFETMDSAIDNRASNSAEPVEPDRDDDRRDSVVSPDIPASPDVPATEGSPDVPATKGSSNVPATEGNPDVPAIPACPDGTASPDVPVSLESPGVAVGQDPTGNESDDEVSDGEVSNGEVSDDEVSDDEVSDGEVSNGDVLDDEFWADQGVKSEDSDCQSSDGQETEAFEPDDCTADVAVCPKQEENHGDGCPDSQDSNDSVMFVSESKPSTSIKPITFQLGPVDGAKMDESPENYEEVLAKFKCILEGRLSKLSSVKDAKINTLKRKYCEDKQKINDDYLNSVNTLRDDILDGLMKKIEDSADSNTKDTSSDSE